MQFVVYFKQNLSISLHAYIKSLEEGMNKEIAANPSLHKVYISLHSAYIHLRKLEIGPLVRFISFGTPALLFFAEIICVRQNKS